MRHYGQALNKESIVYSFGIGTDISFDEEIIKKHGCKVFGFDPTPKSAEWISQRGKIDSFKFYKFGISNKSGEVKMFLPKNHEYVSGSLIDLKQVSVNNHVTVEVFCISDIVKMFQHERIDVLKMDIEGMEYDVIEDLIGSQIKVHQILIEFHSRFFKNGRERTLNSIRLLEENGFMIFAVSPTLEEISFINPVNSIES